jgi:peptide/nickel transport system permease protein
MSEGSVPESAHARTVTELELELDVENELGSGERRHVHGLRFFLRYLRRDRAFFAGIVMTLLIVLIGVFSPVLATHDPELSVASPLVSPSTDHLMGTDSSGMDVFSRVIWSTRTGLAIAIGATAVALAVGVPFGLGVGYFAGRRGAWGFLAGLSMRALDMLQAFPVFVLAMVLVAVTQPSVATIIFALSFVNVPIYVRLLRAEILGWRDRQFLEAARLAGNSEARVAVRHLLPNVLEPVLAQASVTMGMSMLIAAGLSFVGAGIAPPTPEWGSMIAIGARDVFSGKWWAVVFPGLALGLTVFSFALLGEGVRRYVNPRTRLVLEGRDV